MCIFIYIRMCFVLYIRNFHKRFIYTLYIYYILHYGTQFCTRKNMYMKIYVFNMDTYVFIIRYNVSLYHPLSCIFHLVNHISFSIIFFSLRRGRAASLMLVGKWSSCFHRSVFKFHRESRGFSWTRSWRRVLSVKTWLANWKEYKENTQLTDFITHFT